MSSLIDSFAFCVFLLFLFMSGHVLVLQLRIIALQDAQSTADTSSTSEDTIKTLHGRLEALRVDNKTSEDISGRRQGIIDALLLRIKQVEDLPASPPDTTTEHSLAELRHKVNEMTSQVEHLKTDKITMKKKMDEMSRRLGSFSSERLSLLSTISKAQDEMDLLRATIAEQRNTIYQLSIVCAKFDSLKECMHKMVEAGGDRMVIAVLFLGVLALEGVEMAQLGIDNLKLETYHAYATAMVHGFGSALFPQDGVRLKGIQCPLTGLRVVGTRIVGATNTIFAHSSPFAAPASWTAPQQYQTSSSAPPSAPAEGFATFSAPAPPPQEIPKALAPPRPLPIPSSAPPVGFTVASAPPPAPQQPTSTSAPLNNAPEGLSFQPSKKPESFGVKAAANSSGIAKASGGPTKRH